MSSMVKHVNSFSLLGDEEEDDVITLVGNLAKKVDQSNKDNESSKFAHNESVQPGSGDGNYSRDGSWGAIEDVVDEQGESNETTGVDQTDKDNDGWQDVSRSYRKGHSNSGSSFGDGQWKNYKSENMSQGRGRRADRERYYGNNASNGQKRRYNNGNRSSGGERRVNGDFQVRDNRGGDGQTRYRNENRDYGGDRRGNGGNQVQGSDGGYGQRRYRNGNRGYSQDRGDADGKERYRNRNRGAYGGGTRGYYRDQVKGNDAGSGEQNGEGSVLEGNNLGGEETNYESRNQNYRGERRGRGGYKGSRGRSEFRRKDSDEVKETGNADDKHDVNAEHANGFGGDAAAVLNASEAVAAEKEKNASELVNGDVSDPKEHNKSDDLGHKRKETEEERKKKEEERKKKEEEEKEAALMTLDQYYEKLRSEKQKLLELNAQKTEVRRVAIDNDFEKMQLFERKQEDIDDRWSSICKPKTERVKGQVVNDSDAKLKIEGSPDMTVKFEKERGRKHVVVEAHEIFGSAFRPRRFGGRGGGGERGDQGGRGRGRGRAGDQGGRSHRDQGGRGTEHGEQVRFRDRVDERVPEINSEASAPPPRPEDFPKDFPELAPGSTSTPLA